LVLTISTDSSSDSDSTTTFFFAAFLGGGVSDSSSSESVSGFLGFFVSAFLTTVVGFVFFFSN